MRKPYRDKSTGDQLTRGEYISWLVQGIIRRWTFLVIVTIATAIAWSTNNAAVLLWWNLCASFLAIMIESVVGIAMFSQTRRDATVLREVRAIGSRIEKIAEVVLKDVEQIEEQLEENDSHSHVGNAG